MNTDELGFVETPAPLADWLAAEVLLQTPTQGDRILYPGAGRGNLAAAVHRRCSVRELPAPDATFIERHPERAACLRDRFEGPDAPMNNGVPERSDASVEWHTPYRSCSGAGEIKADVEVVETDFLWDPPAGPFDYVVMNPPYTAYPQIATDDREAYADRFETASGQFPLYAPFVEQALRVLADDGILAFLTPDSYLTLGVTEPLRWRLRQATTATPLLVPELAFEEMVRTAITVTTPGDSNMLGPTGDPHEQRFGLTSLGGRLVSLLFERLGVPESERSPTIQSYFERAKEAHQRARNASERDLDGDHPAIVDGQPPTDEPTSSSDAQATLDEW